MVAPCYCYPLQLHRKVNEGDWKFIISCLININLFTNTERAKTNTFQIWCEPFQLHQCKIVNKNILMQEMKHTWQRQHISASAAIMSTIFPFPSSPHCVPSTTVTGFFAINLCFFAGTSPFCSMLPTVPFMLLWSSTHGLWRIVGGKSGIYPEDLYNNQLFI